MRLKCHLMFPAAALLLLACSEAVPTDGQPDLRVPSVVVAPDSVELTRYDTRRLSVTAWPVAGEPVREPKVEWASSHPAVAEVGLDGLLRAFSGGRSTITARVGERTDSVRVRVDARESFDIAFLYGSVRDTRGNIVTRSALRSAAWVGECTGRPLIEAKFGTSSQGTFSRLMAISSIFEFFPGCVIVQVVPLHGSGLLPFTTKPQFVRFVDNGRPFPVDSLRLDLVLEDSGAVSR